MDRLDTLIRNQIPLERLLDGKSVNKITAFLFTNGTHPYFRAPHIYVALPTRFMANRSSITDIVFMAARPGSA